MYPAKDVASAPGQLIMGSEGALHGHRAATETENRIAPRPSRRRSAMGATLGRQVVKGATTVAEVAELRAILAVRKSLTQSRANGGMREDSRVRLTVWSRHVKTTPRAPCARRQSRCHHHRPWRLEVTARCCKPSKHVVPL